jgi:transcriptional regulator with XRE-family HTH domain
MLGGFVKTLRLKNKLTQGFVAGEIEVSRPTYLQIEKGQRELTVGEAQKLADLFGQTLDNFLAEREIRLESSEKKEKKKNEALLRISIPQNNLEKFKQVLLYILAKVGSRPNIGETAIYKLLYFIDFDYYEKYEEQLIGAKYIRNTYGPTPVHFKKVVEEMTESGQIEMVASKFFAYPQRKYLPKVGSNLSTMTAKEIKHIDLVLERLAGKTAKELSDYSHTDAPWLIKKPGEALDYESVFYRDPLHSVRDNFEDEL